MKTDLFHQLKDNSIDKLKHLYNLALDANEHDNEELLHIYNYHVSYYYQAELPVLTQSQLTEIQEVIEMVIIDRYLLG